MAAVLDPERITRALAGDRGALARVLSTVEAGGDGARAVAAAVSVTPRQAWTVGITGAPGAGKSTLTDRLVGAVRAGGDAVAVLAIDPTSPFSGGAILGDRIRMQQHSTDTGVYIRSMATRGHLGGLSAAAPQAARVLDAAGYPWVLVETVGVGQVEVEIAAHADTTVVVVNPGWGDAVQASKAGLMEIADVFVVNKADRAGAADTVREVQGALDLAVRGTWRPPVVSTVAATGQGTDDLWAAIRDHRAHLEHSGAVAVRRRAQAADELRAVLSETVLRRALDRARGERFEALVDDLHAGRTDAYRAAAELLDDGA